jgi:hypothetical protein
VHAMKGQPRLAATENRPIAKRASGDGPFRVDGYSATDPNGNLPV